MFRLRGRAKRPERSMYVSRVASLCCVQTVLLFSREQHLCGSICYTLSYTSWPLAGQPNAQFFTRLAAGFSDSHVELVGEGTRTCGI